jgi:hypothetical protein
MTRAIYCSLLMLACVDCTGPDAGDHRSFRAPPREGFDSVSDMFSAHCGSLDCHGQVGRSLRIYGTNGLRFAADDIPGVDGGVTSAAEHDANYRSAIALEPEILDQVVREAGKQPERLTLVNKARGTEHHKGGTALDIGSDADACLLSWLESSVDGNRCAEGAKIPRPPQ